ncbi:hypothetical protein KAS79_03535 [Candidatus Parcubacteria bacterium]|nr:hypothetical protein [Candidatus Parcubacteria bacterium]
MNKFLNGYFFNPSKGNLVLEQVIQEIFRYMEEKPDKFYDIIVGCDSSSEENPQFPVVIVALRTGEGGRFFLKRINYKNNPEKKFYNRHQRILEEVLLSCELALCLREFLAQEIKKREKEKLNYQFRYIHADVGENGGTKDMIKEVVGLIRGNGFEPKIKPEACVASIVADRFT